MPSFIVHSVAGEELNKRLGFDKKTHNKFFVANLLPDTVQLERDPNLSPEELRKAIQKLPIKCKIVSKKEQEEGGVC